jgi:photosystem II stability/assembly factor-like uncharacterized protein
MGLNHSLQSRRLKTISYTIALGTLLFFSACYKKENWGAFIQQVQVPAGGHLNHIYFVNDTLGYIMGGDRYAWGDILTTQDGGTTWELFHLNDQDGKALYGGYTFGNRTYGVSLDGKIFIKTTTEAWRFVQTNWWEWFQSVTFPEANKGFITTGLAFKQGNILQIDSLGHVQKVDSFNFELADIQFPDAQTGYVCGYGAVLKTGDGGDHWQLQDVQGDFFKGISCIDREHVWIVGYNGSIIHTDDGGKRWHRQRDGNNPLLKRYRLRAVAFRDLQTGYAVGDRGLILSTTDGGNHWQEIKRGTAADLRAVTFHPEGSIWITGDRGTLLKIKL